MNRNVQGDLDIEQACAEARDKLIPRMTVPDYVPSIPSPGNVQLAPPAKDPVHRPNHYARFPIEPITFIMANSIGFAAGNVIKYVMRWDGKDGIQDLKKARRYIDMMIEDAERKAAGKTVKVEAL